MAEKENLPKISSNNEVQTSKGTISAADASSSLTVKPHNSHQRKSTVLKRSRRVFSKATPLTDMPHHPRLRSPNPARGQVLKQLRDTHSSLPCHNAHRNPPELATLRQGSVTTAGSGPASPSLVTKKRGRHPSFAD